MRAAPSVPVAPADLAWTTIAVRAASEATASTAARPIMTIADLAVPAAAAAPVARAWTDIEVLAAPLMAEPPPALVRKRRRLTPDYQLTASAASTVIAASIACDNVYSRSKHRCTNSATASSIAIIVAASIFVHVTPAALNVN